MLVQTIIKHLTLKENLLKIYLKNTENIDILLFARTICSVLLCSPENH